MTTMAIIPKNWSLSPSGWSPKIGHWFGSKVEPQQQASWFGRNLCAFSAMVSSSAGLHTLTKMGLATAQIFVPYRFISGETPSLVPIHSFFKAVDIVPDMNYWLGACPKCAQKARDFLTVSANAFYTVSDAACTISFANFLGLVNSSGLASSLGALSLYGVQPLAVLTSVSLGTFILSTATIGFSISTFQSYRGLEAGNKKLTAYLPVVASAAEVAVRLLLLSAAAFCATVTGVIIVGTLGFIAASSAGYGIYQASLVKCTPVPPPQAFTGNK